MYQYRSCTQRRCIVPAHYTHSVIYSVDQSEPVDTTPLYCTSTLYTFSDTVSTNQVSGLHNTIVLHHSTSTLYTFSDTVSTNQIAGCRAIPRRHRRQQALARVVCLRRLQCDIRNRPPDIRGPTTDDTLIGRRAKGLPQYHSVPVPVMYTTVMRHSGTPSDAAKGRGDDSQW